MPVDLTSSFSIALSASGYDVTEPGPLEGRSGTPYAVGLVANRDGQRFIVDAVNTRAVAQRDLDALAEIVDDTDFDGAILFALRGTEDDLEAPVSGTVRLVSVPDALARALDPGPAPGSGLDETAEPDVHGAEAVEPAVAPVDPVDDALAALGTRSPTDAPAAATTPADDDSDAEWLTDPPSGPEPEPEPVPEPRAGLTPDAPAQAPAAGPAAADGQATSDPDVETPLEAPPESDAEWLPSKPRAKAPGPAADDPATTGPPAPGREPTDEPEPMPTAPPESDAEWLPSKPRTRAPMADEQADRPGPGPGEQRPAGPTAAEASQAPSPSRPSSPSSSRSPPSSSTASSSSATQRPSRPGKQGRTRSSDSGFLSGTCLEPVVDEREARRTAEPALFAVDTVRLELLPFHVYRYTCTIEGGQRTEDRAGTVWVSATTGRPAPAPDEGTVEELSVPFDKLKPTLGPDEAADGVRGHLVDLLTRREEVRQDYGESAVIERVTLKPRPGSIHLEHIGTAHAPRWRVEGQNGHAFVDAVTGDLLPGKEGS